MAAKAKYLFIILVVVKNLHLDNATLFAQTNTTKPWTFWWWMGNAVNEDDIKYQLEGFKKVGIGGVHIIPVYGVKGFENQYQYFLSSQWMKSLNYTVNEAKRLGLGVDVTTGTGWPFGGPNITVAMGAKKWSFDAGKFSSLPTMQKVKRASPSGEGYVLDPFDKNAMAEYLTRFDTAFSNHPGIRSFYNDSYEVYGANWTDRFLVEFKKRRGYELQTVSQLFLDSSNNQNSVLVKMDYQQTLSELLFESASVWTKWCKQHGYESRYQAHGSPANILDLYGLASIPETESFGNSRFPIPLLRKDSSYLEKFGYPNVLAMKFASSSANIASKKLISSETGTWLGNHFKVSLSQLKPQVDELFTAGINHIIYHGTTYSPKSAKYPGWLFYASTNFSPSSHFYNEFPLFNKYVFNCQKILQNSKSDNDVLVYFPINDIWANPETKSWGISPLDVHHTETWLLASAFGKLCSQLKELGFSFDYISDKQLQTVKVGSNGIETSSNVSYKVLIIPACSYMPLETLQQLNKMAMAGASIIFDTALPKHTTGYANFNNNSIAFENLKQQISHNTNCVITKNLDKELTEHHVTHEAVATNGLSFIRKKQAGKSFYFISNLSNKFSEGWVAIENRSANGFYVYDPLTEENYDLPIKKSSAGTQVYLSLKPGQSCFLLNKETASQKIKSSDTVAFIEHKINVPWKVTFEAGRPNYTKSFYIDSLQSWTTLSDTASIFSGSATYTSSVTVPANLLNKKELVLFLGDVRESATVTINNQLIGTVWCLPFQLKIPISVLKQGANQLEIKVTNLSANYMRVYDKEHPEWKQFNDIGFVDIQYKPFGTASWLPVPSGLVVNDIKILYK